MRFRLNPLPDLDEIAKGGHTIFYAVKTCWWATHTPYTIPGNMLPCDPRGSPLLMSKDGDAAGFIKLARGNPAHYGRHGIDAFRAAYHGVVECFKEADAQALDSLDLKDPPGEWLPTSLVTWDEYNDILDAVDGLKTLSNFTVEDNRNDMSRNRKIQISTAAKLLQDRLEKLKGGPKT